MTLDAQLFFDRELMKNSTSPVKYTFNYFREKFSGLKKVIELYSKRDSNNAGGNRNFLKWKNVNFYNAVSDVESVWFALIVWKQSTRWQGRWGKYNCQKMPQNFTFSL